MHSCARSTPEAPGTGGCLPAQEAAGQGQGVNRVGSLRDCEEGSFRASSWFLSFAGTLWCFLALEASDGSVPSPTRGDLSASRISMSKFPPLIRTPVTWY